MKRLAVLTVLVLFVLACSFVPATQLVVVTATPPPATATPYPTYTPYPTNTSVPTNTTVPETATPYPTYTPYPTNTVQTGVTQSTGAPTVTVSVDTQCRIGPGQHYVQLSGLVVGKTGKVVGKSADGQYWIIKNPTDIGSCWLWAEYATVTGDTSNLKVYDEPTWLKDYQFKMVVFTYPDTVNLGKCYYQVNLVGYPNGMVVTFQTRERILGEWKQLAKPQDFTIDESPFSIYSIGSIKIKGDLVETIITTTINGEKIMIGLSVDDNNCK